MLESEIKKLTTAITELTIAINTADSPIKSESAPSTQGTTKDTAPVEVQAPAPVVPDTTVVPAATTEVVADKVPTKKALVEKFIELAQTKDREIAVKLLADFGVAKLPELTDKSKWAPFIAAVDALLA